jgi:hypothetical protein
MIRSATEGAFSCPWNSEGCKSLLWNYTNAPSLWLENNGFVKEERKKTKTKDSNRDT